MRKLIFLVLVLAVVSSNSVAAEATFFILPPEKGASLLHQCSRPSPQGADGFWKPTASEIIDLESRLVTFLRSAPSSASVLPLSNFRRQYVGFHRNGKRYIYGNFYTSRIPPKNESTEPVMVCDGGASFWGVVFSVDSKEFQELAFNGVA